MKSTSPNFTTMEKDLDSKLPKTQSLKKLLKLSFPHKKKIIIASICVILVNTAQLIQPYILKIVIDDFLIKHNAQKGLHSITFLGILYFLVVLLSSFFSIVEVNLINKAGQEIMRTLRSKVFKTIQLLPLWYLDNTSSGRLITRATNDVEALSEMYTDDLINIFQDVFMIIGLISIMLIMNLQLALISFCVVPIMFVLVFILKEK